MFSEYYLMLLFFFTGNLKCFISISFISVKRNNVKKSVGRKKFG